MIALSAEKKIRVLLSIKEWTIVKNSVITVSINFQCINAFNAKKKLYFLKLTKMIYIITQKYKLNAVNAKLTSFLFNVLDVVHSLERKI